MLMFAHNNGLFDYGKMAYAAACAASYYLGEQISVVTDESTWEDLCKLNPHIEDFFDQRIIIENETPNKRHFDMVDGTTQKAAYHNTTRLRAYELSPYDETLMIDTDVLVQDPSLRGVWGSPSPVMMNSTISEMHKEIHAHKHTTQMLSPHGLPSLWATICYFRKCHIAAKLFEAARYVVENYSYFGVLYRFPTNLLRMDFVMTVAAHIVSGYVGGRTVVDPLPFDRTLFAWNKDIMIEVDRGKATFITDFQGQRIPVVTRQTVHVMNKDSMMQHADRIIELYA